ncbi:MAG: RluA family pseudouridine synthase [Burkholderiales bacterium]|jgi:23S rRNA pseudouridine1911/1915/1917 synthase|nr:RluA family pseudouridine synthase [Betaproteobacteria bacterium]
MHTNDLEDDDYSPATIPDAEPDAIINTTQTLRTPLQLAGSRLDQALAVLFPTSSRSRLSSLVKSGDVTLDGQPAQPKTKLTGGETISIHLKSRPEDTAFLAESIPLDVVHEDADVIIINKQPGIVVHPAVGNWSGTILNGMLFRYPETAHVPRAGIVHRLDKDTSGLMVVARSEAAQLALVRQLQARSVSRRYVALLRGVLDGDGTIDAAIGRHPRDRIKMAVVNNADYGKPAITHYTVLEQFRYHTLVECRLETGRTHQIRVHMASLGFPLEGDAVYGKGARGLAPSLQDAATAFGRQALHARALAFEHPSTHKVVSFEAAIPEDMETLIAAVAEV